MLALQGSCHLLGQAPERLPSTALLPEPFRLPEQALEFLGGKDKEYGFGQLFYNTIRVVRGPCSTNPLLSAFPKAPKKPPLFAPTAPRQPARAARVVPDWMPPCCGVLSSPLSHPKPPDGISAHQSHGDKRKHPLVLRLFWCQGSTRRRQAPGAANTPARFATAHEARLLTRPSTVEQAWCSEGGSG